jgi:GT2 family glycosyltransferase
MIHILAAVHNRKEMTQRFLEALRAQTFKDFDVTIVDDGSTDGTSELLGERFPEVKIIHGDGNLWWTGAMRLGAEEILRSAKKGDFILCANNDQIADSRAVEVLLNTSLRHGRALVGSLCKDFSSPDLISDAAYSIDWRTGRHIRIPTQSHGEYAGTIDVLTARFTIIPIEVFERVQFDSERFPHYLGDYDFFIQAKNKGFRLVFSYDSVIHDMGGKSGNERAGTDLTLKQAWNNMFDIRSHMNVKYMSLFILKNCPNPAYKPHLLGYLGLKSVLHLLGAAIKAPVR